jgi:DNA-directed RNA polymerase specialized sigma24 family protein
MEACCMSPHTDLRLLTLAGIAHRCRRETALFFQRQSYDPRYCFELFRRAIVGHDQRAWELIYAQYRPLVAGWVERHSAFPDSGEEIQYFVNRAFEKMWAALNSDKFSHFSDLGSLLRYLQMCVHSVILDQVRVAERCVVGVQAEDLAAEKSTIGPIIEDQALNRVHRQEFWREINARVRDEKEHRVVYGSFILALKPRELYARFQETFRDVNEVYRVKENVLARLRRDAALRNFLDGDA